MWRLAALEELASLVALLGIGPHGGRAVLHHVLEDAAQQEGWLVRAQGQAGRW